MASELQGHPQNRPTHNDTANEVLNHFKSLGRSEPTEGLVQGTPSDGGLAAAGDGLFGLDGRGDRVGHGWSFGLAGLVARLGGKSRNSR